MSVSTLCLVLSGLLWGTGGLIGTLLGRAAGLSAMSVASYRLLAGGGLIVAFLSLTGKRWPSGRAAWSRIAVNGLLSALFQSCYFGAIALSSVSLATLVTIGAAPVIVAIAEHASGRRPLTRANVITTALALAGLGLIALLPLAAVLGGGIGFRPSLASAGLLAALGVGPTAAAYTLYFRGLRKASASTAALLTLIEPLAAALLAAAVLEDRLSATGIVGAVVLLAAVVRTVRADARPGGD
jgi:DME family drug/metabolite transporter